MAEFGGGGREPALAPLSALLRPAGNGLIRFLHGIRPSAGESGVVSGVRQYVRRASKKIEHARFSRTGQNISHDGTACPEDGPTRPSDLPDLLPDSPTV
jgi:hypothetical protein